MHLILLLCILSSRSTLKSENDAQLRAFMKEEESAEIPAAVQKVAIISPSSSDSLISSTGGFFWAGTCAVANVLWCPTGKLK